MLRSGFWHHPMALARQVVVDGDPKPIRIMSENLVLFQDDNGEVSARASNALHAAQDLSFGRVEDEHGAALCIHRLAVQQGRRMS